MKAWPGVGALGIGTKLTLAFGSLAGVTFLIVALAWVAALRVTNDIDLSELVRRPASLASTQAQADLLRMQLHVRGYLVLSDPADLEQYRAARRSFEGDLAALQSMSDHWPEPEDAQAVHALVDRYRGWAELPQQLFDLHDSPLMNRPAFRLARVEVQSRLVRVLDAVDRIAELQRARERDTPSRELLGDLLNFQTSFDAMATSLMAFGASGEVNFKLTYGPQLATNAAAWSSLSDKRALFNAEQRGLLEVIARNRAEVADLALQIVTVVNGDHAYEDLYLYRTKVDPQADALLQRLAELATRQQLQLGSSLARARDRLGSVRLVAGIAGLLAVSIAAIMAYAFRRTVVVPLQRLTDVAERVRAGDLAARAQVESHDEIGVLANSINTMTERLSETIRHLESVFAEAQRAKASAEVASRAKSSFLANMSHELRTPLNAVLGYAQILEGEPGLSDFQRHGLATIRRGGEQLLSQINDVLDLSRIEAGKVELQLQPVDLPGLLQELESTVGAAARQKGLSFSCECAPDLPSMVRVDGPRLAQVLSKLLGNAVKFTERGQVGLRVRRLEAPDAGRTRLQFEVADSGIGIAPEHMPLLFRPFEQAGDAQRQYGGTGLGLAICQQVVSMMGGSIQVESERGKGSLFRFELEVELASSRPAPEPHPQAPAAAGAEPQQRLPQGASPASSSAGAALPAPPLVVPAADELELLHALARMGNMRSLGERAEYLAHLDPAFEPFADRLRQLAQRFQSRAILDWIGDLRRAEGNGVNAPVRGTNAGL